MNRNLLASAICASLLVTGAAYAQNAAPASPQPQNQSTSTQSTQTQPSTQTEQQKELKTLEHITVSGSLLKRPEYQTTVPVQVVPIEAQLATGAVSTANLLQSTAIAMGSTQINNQFSGFVIGGGTGIETIDLRGLGANRTLVLMDGQRPGPAGTQGQTGSGFDLNVVPDVILGRVEIVKDGSSSIYGSDAIAGVVNLITKKRIDGTKLNVFYGDTQHGGGASTSASIAHGFNFDKGNIIVAAQFTEQFPLAYKDRDFLNCSNDLVYGTNGQRIDRQDRSILEGTSLAGCNNLYANTIIYPFATKLNGITYRANTLRFVPSRDGSTIGPFPGYHPRPYNPTKGRYSTGPNYKDDGVAYYEDVLNFPFYGDGWAINKNRNSSFYASSNFNFDTVQWTNQFLYNHRRTDTKRWRQFFPIAYDAASDDYYEPILPYPSNSFASVDWYYFRSALDGAFGNSSWTWQANVTYSHDKGEYGHVGIDARKSGDLTYDVNELFEPPVDYFDPAFLSGQRMGDLVNAIGLPTRGRTTYKQTTVNFTTTGTMFTLPAGDVVAAVGGEFRRTQINDVPDPNNSAGYEWGYSSAQVTKGSDHVYEAFGEVGVPLVKGVPGIDLLSVDLSARTFKYASVGNPSRVWKYGLNWQILPTFRVRGSIGTSYRAPGLYELYLGNQSGFLAQTQIDPCVLYTESSNPYIRQNCAAAGIPPTYAGGGSSAQIFQGGGKGFLDPETSRAKSIGFAWTPTFANFNLALDYFDYHIHGEIGTLGASTIVTACYNRPIYPNAFCGLFDRKPATDPSNPFQITAVHATFININQERTRGYDLQMNYSQDFSFGKISADAEITKTLEDTTQLFSSTAASGFNSSNRVGYIGNPEWTALLHATYKRGDWSVNWQGTYFSSTTDYDAPEFYTYQGYPDARRLVKAKWQFRHDLSVGYDRDKWGVIAGVRNVLDDKPDLVSTGVSDYQGFGRQGNIASGASQYDWFGRSYFVRAKYSF